MSVYIRENHIHLREALNSIFTQTVRASQVVIVCDGVLTDDLYNVIYDFLYKYPNIVEIIKYSENKGLGEALNIGLQHCKYDYVARMDTDDIARNNRFEIQCSYLMKHPEIDVLGSSIAEFESNPNEIVSYRKVPTSNEDIKKFSHNRNPFNHMTVFFKKSVISAVGGYLDMPYAEDYYLWARVIQADYKCANIDDYLVYVRAGDSMYKRRGGYTYAKNMFIFRHKLYEMGFLNTREFILNSIKQSIVALSPTCFRRFIYKKLLRN